MQRSFTAVIERNKVAGEAFVTEPYEVGWASEVIVFVHALTVTEGAELEFRPEVSPDGIHWCPHGGPALTVSRVGVSQVPLQNFGNWLRLSATSNDPRKEAVVIVYFSLKG